EVQQELVFNMRNKKVYIDLSSKLRSLGFNKEPKQCREKIKKLKQFYKRIKNGDHVGGSSSVWFSIMDEVLSSQTAAVKHSETADSSSTESSLPTQSVPVDVNTDGEFVFVTS
uniref:Myb/SANT-like DNA-binding domain-containing protein n=1 Tax=Acanthochromis polyacanthus TaxID=80966 RepID=A0A3Q1G8Z1_9TELE